MNAGDTFLFVEAGADDHLWMIISDPAQDPNEVVVVRFLSWTEKNDQACVLDVGSHPFVKHPTCVDYPAARLVSDSALEKLKQQGHIRLKAPLPAETLTLIRTRAADADIPTACIAKLGEQGLTQYP